MAICAIRAMPASGASVSMEPVPASTAATIRRPRMGCSIRLMGPACLDSAGAASWVLMKKGHAWCQKKRVALTLYPERDGKTLNRAGKLSGRGRGELAP
jgi:hypothetical protein